MGRSLTDRIVIGPTDDRAPTKVLGVTGQALTHSRRRLRTKSAYLFDGSADANIGRPGQSARHCRISGERRPRVGAFWDVLGWNCLPCLQRHDKF